MGKTFEKPWVVVDTLGNHAPVGCWYEDTARRLAGDLRRGYDPGGRYKVMARADYLASISIDATAGEPVRALCEGETP